MNITIQARSTDGLLESPYPVMFDHGCSRLHFYEGTRAYHEHNSAEDVLHLWMRARVGKGGTIRVEGLGYGYYDNGEDPVPFGKPPPRRDPEPGWKGKHPPFGEWTVDMIRRFSGAQIVVGLSPFGDMKIHGDDEVGDVLVALGQLRKAMPGRVFAGLVTKGRFDRYFKR